MSIRCLTLAAMTLLMSATALIAQTPARPDLSGIWTRTGAAANENFGKGTPPLQPAAKAIYDENRVGTPPGTDEGHDQVDPTIYCLPLGMPRALSSNNPFEIVQAAKVVYMLFEAGQMQRRIYLDGRKLPENYPNSFMGFSTGKYDGDALVVETAGLDGSTWLDRGAIPHTDALRVTERFRRAAPDTLEISFRFDDPKTFAKPWEAKKTYTLKPDWEILENIGYCEDRYQYNFGRKAFKGTVRWQSPEQAAGGR